MNTSSVNITGLGKIKGETGSGEKEGEGSGREGKGKEKGEALGSFSTQIIS